jgi:mRNA interferase MazF
VRRGEVRWYSFKLPDKRRPVLILTRNTALGFLTSVSVAPITRTVRDIPSEVYLDGGDGLPGACAANFDNIVTVQKSNVGGLITTLSQERMMEAERAIRFALGFETII